MDQIDFSEITREEIIKAFHKYNKLEENNELNKHRKAKDYILFWNSKEYPQKYIIGIAYALKYNQNTLDSSLYNATGNHSLSAQWCLEKNGFILYADKKYKNYLELKYDNKTTINTYYSDLKKAIKIFQNIENLKEKNLNEIFEIMQNSEISFEEYDRAQKELGFDDKQLYSTLKTKAKTYLEAIDGENKNMNTIRIKVGEFLQEHVENIIDMCNSNKDEFLKLQDILYTKTTFGLRSSYPLFNKLSNIKANEHYNRYYKKDYNINGDIYRICSQFGGSNIIEKQMASEYHGHKIYDYLTRNNLLLDKFQDKDIIFIVGSENNNPYELDSTPTQKNQKIIQPLNQILYGPPGTGKTYHINRLKEQFIYKKKSISDFEWATKIVENLTWFEVVVLCLYDLNQEAKVPNIAKHELVLAKANLLNKEKGVPQQIWAALQTHTVSESTTVNYKTRVEPLIFDKAENSTWKFIDDFEEKIPEISILYDKYKNQKPSSQELHNYDFITFHQSYGYEEFVEGIKAIPAGEVGNEDGTEMIYQVTDGIFKKIADKAKNNPDYEYALFIDEINRGNISKIFGELITLIEDSKRHGKPEQIQLTLPYSGKIFGVPSNLYIIGTMNTADRSIALMDTALRRRFEFTEMMPNLDVVKDIIVEKISIYKLLETINKRVEYLYDRDHTIGHAYFMDLKEEGKDNLPTLSNIFKNKIIPLLQEYFYDDWEKISLVLGDNQKEEESIQFIKIKQGYNLKSLFGEKGLDSLDMDDESSVYEINEVAFNNPESYKKVYEK